MFLFCIHVRPTPSLYKGRRPHTQSSITAHLPKHLGPAGPPCALSSGPRAARSRPRTRRQPEGTDRLPVVRAGGLGHHVLESTVRLIASRFLDVAAWCDTTFAGIGPYRSSSSRVEVRGPP